MTRHLLSRSLAISALCAVSLALPVGVGAVHADGGADDGGSATIATVTHASTICTATSHGLNGTVAITNSGSTATTSLTSTAYLTHPGSTTVLGSTPVDLSSHPTLAAGETHTYSFSFTPPASGSYQVTTVTTAGAGDDTDDTGGDVAIQNGDDDDGGSVVTTASTSTVTCTGGGVTAARVGSFQVVRHTGSVMFHWTAANRTGITGFAIYAGVQRLNPQVIPVHQSPSYRYTARYSGTGHFTLHVVLSGGAQVVISA